MGKVIHFLKKLNNIDDYFNSFFLAFMTIIIFIQVIFRYVLNRSISWSEQLAILMFVWICFLGAAGVIKRGGHFGFDNFVIKMPEKVRIIVEIFVDIISCFFIICFIVGGLIIAISGVSHVVGALGISMRIVYSVIPVAGLVYFIRLMIKSVEKFKRLF